MSVGLGLLVLVVLILAGSGLRAMYAYRALVKDLRWRVPELSVAAELSQCVSDLRVTLSELHGLREQTLYGDEVPVRARMVRDEFRDKLARVEETLTRYRDELGSAAQADRSMADNRRELATVEQIEVVLWRVRDANVEEDWILDAATMGQLDAELGRMQELAGELPSHLHSKMAGFADQVRGQYRTLIVAAWATSLTAALVFALFVRLIWVWILRPLRTLIHGSRRVAAGDFSFPIRVDTRDEMAELARAMNDMTTRFRDVRDGLDAKVRQRTKQAVRSEQLASVGFLAAGVAHEINNPLASIAMCAESLQSRLGELLDADGRSTSDADLAGQREVIDHYLTMVQEEAFRCKGITEKLLDFSRMGPVERNRTDLGELVRGVVEMIGHLGKYQRKQVELAVDEPVVAPVNTQQIKQVVLNLLTNALDSLSDGGSVRIAVRRRGPLAELVFTDDGCGMEPEVLEQVFEPFFTRRRNGQGTGLGLSITHRIVNDHGGSIEAHSDGAGRGATFRVRLPLTHAGKGTQGNARAA